MIYTIFHMQLYYFCDKEIKSIYIYIYIFHWLVLVYLGLDREGGEAQEDHSRANSIYIRK